MEEGVGWTCPESISWGTKNLGLLARIYGYATARELNEWLEARVAARTANTGKGSTVASTPDLADSWRSVEIRRGGISRLTKSTLGQETRPKVDFLRIRQAPTRCRMQLVVHKSRSVLQVQSCCPNPEFSCLCGRPCGLLLLARARKMDLLVMGVRLRPLRLL